MPISELWLQCCLVALEQHIFTARRYTSTVYAVVVCLSVRLYCPKTAKRRITQTTPYDSLGTLVF